MKRKTKPSLSTDERLFLTHPAFADDRKQVALARLRQPFRRHSVLVQLGAFAVVLLLWKVPIVNHIKLLVVLFHESSHVFMALLTGGTVFGIAIDPGGAGVTLGMGGDPLLILAAGYIGSLLIGSGLCVLTAIWEPREVWAVLGVLAVVPLSIGWLTDFSAFFGYGTVFLIFLSTFMLGEGLQKFVLRMVATASCLYPLIDVLGEVVAKAADGFKVRGQVVGSDVSQLAQLTHIPAAVLGAMFIVVGLTGIITLIAWTSRKEATIAVRLSLFRRRKPESFQYKRYDPTKPDSIPEYTIR